MHTTEIPILTSWSNNAYKKPEIFSKCSHSYQIDIVTDSKYFL